jgi:signal transduction histidine kinase
VAEDTKARYVEIAIRKTRQRICMTITNDGKAARSVSEKAGASEQRLTLLGMQERIRLINGQFTIITRRRGGAAIRVFIPHLTNPPMA